VSKIATQFESSILIVFGSKIHGRTLLERSLPFDGGKEQVKIFIFMKICANANYAKELTPKKIW